MRRLFIAGTVLGLFLLGAGEAHAQWAWQWSGRYAYLVNGESQAFPQGALYYQKLQGRTPNEWSFYHPTQDPQAGPVYLAYWTDGQRIFQRYSTRGWTEWTDCNPQSWQRYWFERRQMLMSQLRSDFAPFYAAQNFEAERLFRACEQIYSRRAAAGR
jgi:hypothetical protein